MNISLQSKFGSCGNNPKNEIEQSCQFIDVSARNRRKKDGPEAETKTINEISKNLPFIHTQQEI